MNARILDAVVQRHRRNGVLVDTNLLLVFLIGQVNPESLCWKRTIAFHPDDFKTLCRFLSLFPRLITTPHILTETSNLLGQYKHSDRHAVIERYCQVAAGADERFLLAKSIRSVPDVSQFGLADCLTMALGSHSILVLTDDFRLAGRLKAEGRDVINFNYIRELGWS